MRRREPRNASLPLFVGVLLLCACRANEEGSGPTVSFAGDTTRVIYADLPPTTHHLELQPEQVLGGQRDGPLGALGSPVGVAVMGGGEVVVADGMGPRLALFDSVGTAVRTIGGPGEGPGEFRRLAGLLEITDSTFLIDDPALGRMTVYSTTGRIVDSWSVPGPYPRLHSVAIAGDGHVAVKRLLATQDGPSRTGFVLGDLGGKDVDTLPGPKLPPQAEDLPGRLQPRLRTAWLSTGQMAWVYGGQPVLYIETPSGGVTVVDLPLDPVPLEGEEREIEDAMRSMMISRGGRDLPELPSHKPYFRQVLPSESGEVWLERHAIGRKLWTVDIQDVPRLGRSRLAYWEPLDVDVFDGSGRHRMRVSGPTRTDILRIKGDTIWAAGFDESNVPIVGRFVARPVR